MLDEKDLHLQFGENENNEGRNVFYAVMFECCDWALWMCHFQLLLLNFMELFGVQTHMH